MKCIYCLEEKDQAYFTKAEHVMPQSFGTFRDNFVLNINNKVICDGCNQYFGDNLEIDLARDTIEGQVRFDHKLKKPNQFKSLGKRSRLIIKIAEGFFKGAHAYRYYSQEENKILLKPVPQIGFLKMDKSGYDFFLLSQIPHKNTIIVGQYNLDDSQGIIILGCDPIIADKILADKGFVFFKKKGVFDCPSTPNSDWLCDIEGTIDQKIFRAVAKISFNYLTYWEGIEFIMHKDFDPIRRYVRTGEMVDYPLVRVVDKAILADEIGLERRRVGHIVTVNWAADRVSIIAQVSLFNWVTYYICLARDFSGERKNIIRGHFFNAHGQEILEMGARKL